MDESAWPPYTSNEPSYYIFNGETNGLGKGPRTAACAFWNDFLPRLKDLPGIPKPACTHTLVSVLVSGLIAFLFSLYLLFLPTCSCSGQSWLTLLSSLVHTRRSFYGQPLFFPISLFFLFCTARASANGFLLH